MSPPDHKVFLGFTSFAGPSLAAVVPGALCMGWTEKNDNRLVTATSIDEGNHWDVRQVPTGDTSIAAPALASHNGKLFMAWTATDGEGNLNVMPSVDGGRTFQADKKHFVLTNDGRQKSIAAPALISYRGLLLIAWTGTDGRGMLNIATSADEGATWQNKTTMPETAIDGPALTFLKGGVSGAGFTTLVIAWTGTDAGHHINTRTCSDTNFNQLAVPDPSKSTFPDTSDFGPSLATAIQQQTGDEVIFITWTGTREPDGRHRLNRGDSRDGRLFGGKKTSDEQSIAKPAILTFSLHPPDQLVYAWTGTDGAGQLNFANGPVIKLGFDQP
jgi:hypothetical protein